MEFRILGPLTVQTDNGAVLSLGRSREQKVLAALLLDAGRVVSVPRLVDVIWDDPPDTAPKLVRNCVSTLRRRLAEPGRVRNLIVTDPAGYALHIDDGQLDARVFTTAIAAARRLASAGDLVPAMERLRGALALWRGPALAAMSGRTIEAAATALNEQRVSVLEECLSYELALGKGHELVAELVGLVAEHPLRERLRGQLMTALYRCGRRGDALDVYRQGRRILVEEIGIEPGVELRRLEQAILRDNPDLGATAHGATGGATAGTTAGPVTARPARAWHAPAQLPADVAAFTGRDAQLAELDGLLEQGDGAVTAVISAVAGAAGVGKTALAVHWAHRVRARFPDGQLYVNLRGHAPDAPMRPADVLAMFLRALDVPAERVPVHVDQAAAMYRDLLADRQVLVLLDNAASAAQVHPLLPGGHGCLLLVTSRDPLAGLVTVPPARYLSVDVMTPAEAEALVARVVGQARADVETGAVADLARACGYLPLALRIAAADVSVSPHRHIAGYAGRLRTLSRRGAAAGEDDGAAAVRSVCDLAYAALSPDAQRMFRRLGLATGPDVTPDAVAALADTTMEQAVVGLDQLAAAHLVAEHRPGRFSCHDLVRRYAADRAQAEEGAFECLMARSRLRDHYVRRADAAARLLYGEILRLPQPPRVAPAPPVPPALPGFDVPAAGLAWLDAERSNLVAAMALAAEADPRPAPWLLPDAAGQAWASPS